MCEYCNYFKQFCKPFYHFSLHLCNSKFLITLKINTMGNLLYIIAVILVIGWGIGFIGFHAGGLIHILLVIALIAVILRIISGRSAT